MTALHALPMPKWGMTMTEGTLVDWLVPEGAVVEQGQEVAEVETTKIANAIEAPVGGILRRQVAAPGMTVPVGGLLGVIADAATTDAEIDAFVAARASADTMVEAAAPAPRLVETAGGPLNLLSLGQGDGLPVVLLHGFGGDLGSWMFTADPLAADRPVHVPDLPGHGASPPRAEATVADLAKAIMQVCDALSVTRVHLVGHSLGGAVALALASAAPERVASLALIAPVGLGREIGAEYLTAFLAADRRRPMKQALSLLFADPEAVSSDMVEGVLRSKRRDGVNAALAATLAGFFDAARGQTLDLRPVLAAFSGPVTILWGEADAILPSGHAAGLPARIAVHRIPGAGHMPMMEAAGTVNRLLAAHLAAADALS
jgi:pyruvate dehydrogenase E2 component (dihydrolipoamide acetyltransferase)